MMVFLCVSMLLSSESFRALLESVFAEASALVVDNMHAVVGVFVTILSILLVKKLFLTSALATPSISVPLTPLEVDDNAPEGKVNSAMNLKDPSRPGYIQCYNPATLAHIGEVKAMTADEVHEAVARAREAQKEWKNTSFDERRRVISTIARYIVEHQEDIVRVACRDSGKTKVDAMFGEVLVVFAKVEYLLKHGERAIAREYRPTGLLTVYKSAWVEYHPLGVIGTIAPWNYPFQNWITHVLSCLLTGNAIVAKVSEHTSWSSQYYGRFVAEALRRTGHNPDLVQTVTGFGDAGAALIDAVDKVIFTGSPGVRSLLPPSSSSSFPHHITSSSLIFYHLDLSTRCSLLFRSSSSSSIDSS